MGEVRQVEVFHNRVKGGRGTLLSDQRASGGRMEEIPTMTCAHCDNVVILHPQRTRERGFCAKCNAYICDSPPCHISCTPYMAIMEFATKSTDLSNIVSAFAKDPYNLMLKDQVMNRERVY